MLDPSRTLQRSAAASSSSSASGVLFAVAGSFGGSVAQQLSSGGFDDPASESFKADDALLDTFGSGTPNLVLLVTADGGSVDDPAVAAAGIALTERAGRRAARHQRRLVLEPRQRSAAARARTATGPWCWPASRATRTR